MQGRAFLTLEGRGIYSFTPRQRLMMWTGLYDLGCAIHPDSVKEAWYGADCPPGLDLRVYRIPLRDRIAHRLSCFLRGC